MNFKVEVTGKFKKDARHLLKKYPSLKQELAVLIESLSDEPKQGKPLGHDCYKIRLAIGSKGKGKSGGARVITHVQITNTVIFLITIYDKSEHDSISDKEILSFIKDI
ncbi:MAG: type II toxin-antitoxin system RelE/ParE family toxin [Bacteroidota bacterium]|nr:type II toxin-antitoxin system RelE/ParE family toxin [Bacteroidota bacterium]